MKYKVKLILLSMPFILAFSNLQAQEGVVHIEQKNDIEKLLEFKKDLSTLNAFIIQVYNGSRSGAEDAKKEVATLYPDWSNSIEYEQPNYKIWVGKFGSRLEADRALVTVKKTYTNAFILQPKKNK